MQKIGDITDTATAEGEFTDGSVAGGTQPTILPAAMFNTWQRELCNVVTGSGLALDPEDDGQLLEAIGLVVTGAIPGAPVTSVNEMTGAVVIDVGYTPSNPPAYPVSSVNGMTGVVNIDVGYTSSNPPPQPDLSPYETIADANARFVGDIQLGAEYIKNFDFNNGGAIADPGGVQVGVGSGSSNPPYHFKPVQKFSYAAGVWANVSG